MKQAIEGAEEVAGSRSAGDKGAAQETGSADESGTGRGRDDTAENRPTPSQPGPAFVRQPCRSAQDISKLEFEAIRDIGERAREHEQRLPHESPWKQLWGDLATSLAGDESRLLPASSDHSGHSGPSGDGPSSRH